MLALVAAVEAAVARDGARFLDSISYSWSLTARAARERAPGCGVLVLGDSQAKYALIPRVLTEGTGLRSYNLAMPAATAPATLAVLRRALDAGARPKAVVFDLKGGLLVGGPIYSVVVFPHVLSPADALRLIVRTRSKSFASLLLLRSALPSYRCRTEVREDLKASLRGGVSQYRQDNAVVERQSAVNDGAYIGLPVPGPRPEVSEAEYRDYKMKAFAAHRVNAAYAREVATTAAAAGAKVYLLLPPAFPKFFERRVKTGAEAKYEAFIRSLQDHHPGLTVLDARTSGYHEALFADRLHVNALAALALSEDVAAVLRRDLAAPGPNPPKRWVRLRAYRDRPLPDWVEHVDLSRARVADKVRK
jgi:hypothetical protein